LSHNNYAYIGGTKVWLKVFPTWCSTGPFELPIRTPAEGTFFSNQKEALDSLRYWHAAKFGYLVYVITFSLIHFVVSSYHHHGSIASVFSFSLSPSFGGFLSFTPNSQGGAATLIRNKLLCTIFTVFLGVAFLWTCQCVPCHCFPMVISYPKVTQPHCG
jgi:hypothetical protein